MLNFKIDAERCVQCGMCVADCPPSCIVMDKQGYPSVPDEGTCIRCQHCLAVCPTGALSIMDADPNQSLKLKGALPTAQSMEALIKGRRSTRSYKQKPVDAETIKKLLNTTWHAPTATNAQSVLFTATTTVEATNALRKSIYAKLKQLVADQDPKDDSFSRKYLRMAYGAYSEHGVDVVFRGAPHILIASAPTTIPLPKEDCIIALTTFDLLAQCNGLGTLWDGMLTWCLTEYFPELAAELGVPDDHQIGYCMVFGHPGRTYHRTVQRTPPTINLIDSFTVKT